MVVAVAECAGGDYSPVAKQPGPVKYSFQETLFIGMSGLSASLAGSISIDHIITRTGSSRALGPCVLGIYTASFIGFGLWGCESAKYAVNGSYKEIEIAATLDPPPQVNLPSTKPVFTDPPALAPKME